MARFEVRVLVDVEQQNASQARKSVEEGLRVAGFDRWRISSLRPHGLPGQRRRPPGLFQRPEQYVGGGILVGAVIMWWLWFWMNLL